MKLQCVKLFIMTKKNEFLEDFREIPLVGSLKDQGGHEGVKKNPHHSNTRAFQPVANVLSAWATWSHSLEKEYNLFLSLQDTQKLPHLFIPSKTPTFVPEFTVEDLPFGRTAALVPEFAVNKSLFKKKT